jgi:hypothetical protein
MYAGCTVISKSQLQSEICLSATKAEYVGISYALRDAIPIIETLREMQEYGYQVHPTMTKVHCRVFEDNSGALEMARLHKSRPRTKHINAKLHHFRSYVGNSITLHKIGTDDQPVDILTKPLPYDAFVKHRFSLLGWSTIIQLQRPVKRSCKRE